MKIIDERIVELTPAEQEAKEYFNDLLDEGLGIWEAAIQVRNWEIHPDVDIHLSREFYDWLTYSPPLQCSFEYEMWGPHEGCREFMTEPEAVFNCSKFPVAVLIYDDPLARAMWERYGPFTDEQIAASDGHIDYYTFTMFACQEHLGEMEAEADPFTDNQAVIMFEDA